MSSLPRTAIVTLTAYIPTHLAEGDQPILAKAIKETPSFLTGYITSINAESIHDTPVEATQRATAIVDRRAAFWSQETAIHPCEAALERKWHEESGINHEGKEWLTPRMQRNAIRVQAQMDLINLGVNITLPPPVQ
jgi:hypothetical protein